MAALKVNNMDVGCSAAVTDTHGGNECYSRRCVCGVCQDGMEKVMRKCMMILVWVEQQWVWIVERLV